MGKVTGTDSGEVENGWLRSGDGIRFSPDEIIGTNLARGEIDVTFGYDGAELVDMHCVRLCI